MYNPVSNAVSEIQDSIPPQILQAVFGREDFRKWRRHAPVSQDEMIKSKVIRKRVLKDCNLLGGRDVLISLEGLNGWTDESSANLIYDIPLDRTGNREIMSILGVSYMPHSAMMGSMGSSYAGMNPIGIMDTQMAGMRVMDSFSGLPHISTAHAELIGYNTVLVRDEMRQSTAYVLRCRLANEEELSNMQPTSYKAFAKACELAVKAYIHKELIILMDQGRLEQGQNLGEFKRIVDQYEEANNEYRTYMKEVMQKVLFMNDTRRHGDFIRVQINPGL